MSTDDTYICPIGKWCYKDLLEYDCPAGRFGNETGLTNSECSGPCAAGYYCPLGSTSPYTHECPSGYYCPEGTGDPLPCLKGYYGSSTKNVNSTCDGLCSPGYYCVAGSSSPTQAICPLGSYCPQGTTFATEFLCPLGTYGNVQGLSSATCQGYCVSNPGYYCPEQFTGDGLSPSAMVECPVGYFCDGSQGANSLQECPGGTYGNSAASSSSACAGSCDPGYYCPAGSVSSKAIVCPKGSYCPGGDAAPILCASGLYGLDEMSVSPTCTGMCDPGFWCANGTSEMNGVRCPAGYYCPLAGTANYLDNPCTAGYACPSGTERPVFGCNSGYYCPEGTGSVVQFPCPAGRYGTDAYLVDANCTGVCPQGKYCEAGTSFYTDFNCPAGYYCPEGTGDPYANPCPGGQYSQRTGLTSIAGCECDRSTDSSCELNNGCPGGYYCPAGSSSPTTNRCPSNYYCPVNSSAPIFCEEPGYYCLSRESSPDAKSNNGTIIVLNNAALKGQIWATDFPEAWTKYKNLGKSLEEAYLYDTSLPTYSGPSYADTYVAMRRGLETVEASVSTIGFYNATVYICGGDGEKLIYIDNITQFRSTSVVALPYHTFSVVWTIPRDFVETKATVCMEFLSTGNAAITVYSDMFEIVNANDVATIEWISQLCVGVFLLGGLVYFGIPRLRKSNIIVEEGLDELFTRPAGSWATFELWVHYVIVMSQFVYLSMLNGLPQLVGEGSNTSRYVFHMVSIIGLNVTPVVGFEIGLLVYITCWSVLGFCQIRQCKRRCFSNRFERWYSFFLFDALYVPTMLLMLSSFDCAYDTGGVAFEFRDEIVLKNLRYFTLQCWLAVEHDCLVALGIFMSMVLYSQALGRIEFHEFGHPVKFFEYFQTFLVVAKTTLCFAFAWFRNPYLVSIFGTYQGVVVLVFMALTYCQMHWNPYVGWNQRWNNRHLAMFCACMIGGVAGLIGDFVTNGVDDGGSSVALFCFLGGLGLMMATWIVVVVVDGRRTKHLMEQKSLIYIETVRNPNPEVRQRYFDTVLNFIVDMTLSEPLRESLVDSIVQSHLTQLGRLSQEQDPTWRNPSFQIIVKLLKCNSQLSDRFRVPVERQAEDEDIFRRSNKIGSAMVASESILGEPIVIERSLRFDSQSMMFLCFSKMVVMDLSHQHLEDADIHFVSAGIPKMRNLRILNLDGNSELSKSALQVLLEALVTNNSLLWFQWNDADLPINDTLDCARLVSQLFVRRLTEYIERKDCYPVLYTKLGAQFKLHIEFAHANVGDLNHSCSTMDELLASLWKLLSNQADVHAVSIAVQRLHKDKIVGNVIGTILDSLVTMRQPANRKSFRIDFWSNIPSLKQELGESLIKYKNDFPLGNLSIAGRDVAQDASLVDLTFGFSHVDLILLIGLIGAHKHLQRIRTPHMEMDANVTRQLAEALVKSTTLEQWQFMDGTELPLRVLRGAAQSNGALTFTKDKSLSDNAAIIVGQLLSLNDNIVSLAAYTSATSRSSLNCLTDAGIEQLVRGILDGLEQRKGCVHLKQLSLGSWDGGNLFGAKGVKEISRILTCVMCPLVTLDLQQNALGPKSCEIIAKALCHNKTVTTLNLSHNRIGNEGAGFLGEMLIVNEALRSLSISSNQITEQGIVSFSEGLVDNYTLETLVLDNNKVASGDAWHDLVGGLHSVISLSIIECGIVSLDVMQIFLSHGDTSSLKSINLSKNVDIDKASLLRFVNVKNQKLLSINLSGCNIDDRVFKELLDTLSKTRRELEVLDLSQNLITDDGCAYLARLIGQNSLEISCIALRLNSGITPEGKTTVQGVTPKGMIVDM